MRKYKIEFIDKGGDSIEVESENDGFSSSELLGLLEAKKFDIYQQIKGELKPDFTKRKFVEPIKDKEDSNE